MSAPKFPISIRRGFAVVKIYRTSCAGYDSFTVTYYEGESRKRKKFSELEKAKHEAEAIATKLCRGELDVLTLSSEDRIAYVRARDHVKPFGVPLELAAAEYAEAKRRLESTPLLEAVDFYLRHCPKSLPKKTVKEVFSELLAAKEGDGCSAVYLKDLRFRVGKFAEAFQCPILNVTARDVSEYLRALTCSGRGRNNFRGGIATLFKFAEVSGYLAKGHVDFDRVPKAKEEHNTIEIFTPQEITALLKAALDLRDDHSPGVNRR